MAQCSSRAKPAFQQRPQAGAVPSRCSAPHNVGSIAGAASASAKGSMHTSSSSVALAPARSVEARVALTQAGATQPSASLSVVP
jgi:hypothetical protein